jgi:hypothetical protein
VRGGSARHSALHGSIPSSSKAHSTMDVREQRWAHEIAVRQSLRAARSANNDPGALLDAATDVGLDTLPLPFAHHRTDRGRGVARIAGGKSLRSPALNLSYHRIMREAGLTTSDIRHCKQMSTVCDAFGDEMVFKAIWERVSRASRRVAQCCPPVSSPHRGRLKLYECLVAVGGLRGYLAGIVMTRRVRSCTALG